LILLLACAAMATGSCSTTETKTKPEKRQSAAGSGEGQAKRNVARVGDTLTLEGQEDGEKMEVTVVKVIDPVPAGEFDEPESGNRFLGVQIRLRNVGDATYDDSPANGAELIMSNDTQAKEGLVSSGDCDSDFGSSAKIAPGATQVGCLPFEAKQATKPKTFQFTLASGFGPQAGEWRLPGGQGGSPGSGGTSAGGSSGSGGGTTDCGGGVSAGPNTSCPFALNVKDAYDAAGGGNVTVHAHSPTTGQDYSMTCGQSSGEHVCTGGNGASVHFP
jgi:Domain of unknown function (DUF4352)